MDWTVPCYLAWQESSHRLTPGHAAPLAKSGPYSFDQNISAPTPPIVQEGMSEPEQLTFFGLKSDRPVQNSDAITTCVTTSEPHEPAN